MVSHIGKLWPHCRRCTCSHSCPLLPATCASGNTIKFGINEANGDDKLVKLSELRDAAAGWLINDTLVLTVEVTVDREDRFQLDAGASMRKSGATVLPGRVSSVSSSPTGVCACACRRWRAL
jgi:hypothetical protein